MPFAKDNPEGQARNAAFLQELQKLGWTEGRNIQIEYRWDTGDLRKAATELVTSSPDVILASSTPAVAHCNRRNLFGGRAEARRITVNIAKLPELLQSGRCSQQL
jgi:hypothetical protein